MWHENLFFNRVYFKYTYELGWKVMKDYALYQGHPEIAGSRDAVRDAFGSGLVSNGKVWMDMIVSRSNISHTYNEETADEIFHKIINEYHAVFKEFKEKTEALRRNNSSNMFEEE